MRRKVAAEWGRRSQAVQAEQRLNRDPDAETVRRRALDDRRGTVIRAGVTYRATGETIWAVAHSRAGRTDQFDVVADGRLWRTCGNRRLSQLFRA